MKATIYFYDLEGDEPLDVLKQTLDSRDWISYDIFNYESVEIGEWYDSIDLNDSHKCKDEKTYLAYFTESRRAIISVSVAVANIMATSKYTGIDIDQAIRDEVFAEIKLKANEILKSWEE